MRSKLIAAGTGLFGYGVLLGWAVTADYFEYRMKSNQRLLGDIIDRQARELDTTKRLLINDPTVEELGEDEGPDISDAEIREARAIFEARRKEIKENPEENYLHGEDQPLREDSSVTIERMRQEAGPQATEDLIDPDAVEEEEDVIPEGETEDQTRARLQGLIDVYAGDEDTVNEFVELSHKAINNIPPFVIPKAKYAWDEEEGDEYDKISLTYFPRERILLDDENEVVDDVANLVGWKSLTRFGDESDDPDVVFVRNRRLETDFEVIRDTENQPPLHVRYGLGRDEFETNRAAGLIRFRPGDT